MRLGLLIAAAGAIVAVSIFVSRALDHEASLQLARCDTDADCMVKVLATWTAPGTYAHAGALLHSAYELVPDFRPRCHLAALNLGTALYERRARLDEADMRQSLAVCNYGLIQSYARAAASDAGTAVAIEACDRLATSLRAIVPGAEEECYRGIGMSARTLAVDSTTDMAAVVAAVCAGTGDSALTCASGAFNAYGRAHPGMDVPTACASLADEETRGRCLGNLKTSVVGYIDVNDLEKAASDIERAYAGARPGEKKPAYWTLGFLLAQHALAERDTDLRIVKACASLGEWQGACIDGAGVGIAKHGEPWQQHRMLARLCATVLRETGQMLDCLSEQAIGYLRGFYEPERFENAMRALARKFGEERIPVVPPNVYGH